jgi:threonine aldolase
MTFASDNYAGVHPQILEAISRANTGSAVAYGDDSMTAELQRTFQRHFGPHTQAYPVFNGTGANVVALQSLTERYGSVICAKTAHVHIDECGAPEKMGGLKLLNIPTLDGKLTPELILMEARGFDDVHRAQPQVVSITQTTELGTAYSINEIAAICDLAHSLGMWVHLDGARIANAAATLEVPLSNFTTDVGVDVLSFGGTKNGLMLGEAVVVLNPTAVRGVDYLRKMSMQLASKMRFISAQLVELMETNLWLANAAHANAMARLLADSVRDVVQIVRPVQANAVFARLEPEAIRTLQAKFPFYVWDETTNEVRWMTSFATTKTEVTTFVSAIRDAVT